MDLEPHLCGDRVLFVERTNELAVWCKVKGVLPGAVVKARTNSPISTMP